MKHVVDLVPVTIYSVIS